ncbi:MAG: T9SS type A sorting domain-containing protein, partial [Planctomycetes bacterium]|nr:T9SS type A sorting domain-containing protein [Planctomycetota bacterium]
SIAINTFRNKSAENILFAGSDSGLYTYDPLIDSSKWTKIEEIPQNVVTSLLGDFQGEMFATTGREVYRSSYGGEQWKALNADSALPAMQFYPHFTCIATNTVLSKTHVYCGSYLTGIEESFSGVIQSNNLGDTWRVHNEGIVSPTLSVFSLCFFRNKSDDPLGLFAAGTDRGIFTHTESETSWSRLKPGIIDSQKINDMCVTKYSTSGTPEIFACTDSGAYLLTAYPDSNFSNAKWAFMNYTGKTLCAHSHLFMSMDLTNYWYVGTEDGLYKCHRDETPIEKNTTVVKSKKPQIIVKFINNTISIHHLQTNHKPNIKLLDSKGKLSKDAAHVTNSRSIINMENLGNGVYFLHFTHDNKSIVKKISFIK